jgi:hypothetical protein
VLLSIPWSFRGEDKAGGGGRAVCTAYQLTSPDNKSLVREAVTRISSPDKL